MGNGTSTIKIRIGSTPQTLNRDHFNVKITTGNYEGDNNFEKYTYVIEYKTPDRNYDLVIESSNGKKTVFTYNNPSKDQDRVTEVSVIFSKSHVSRPLIICFTTKGQEPINYRYHDLAFKKTSRTIDLDDIQRIPNSELRTRLNDEVEIIKEETKPPGSYNSGYGCIYFSEKGEGQAKEYGSRLGSTVKCLIKVSKMQYDNCKNIQHVTYTLIYSGDASYGSWNNSWYRWSNSYYYLYFYTGSGVDDTGTHIFTYYPRNYRHVVKQIDCYCSLMYINQPFLIVLKTESGELLHSSFDNLRSRGSAYNYELNSAFDTHITNLINRAYERKFNNILLKSENKSHYGIKTRHYVLNLTTSAKTVNQYKKVILTSEKSKYAMEESTIYIDNLFSLNKSNDSPDTALPSTTKSFTAGKITNKPITKGLLDDLTKNKHHGVVICYTYPSEVALLVEIYTDRSTKHQFVRHDLDGNVWSTGNHQYDTDGSLAKELKKIETDIATKITYMLDINGVYNDNKVKVSKYPQKAHGYTMYTHLPTQFGHLKSTKVLYKSKSIEIVRNNNIPKGVHMLDKLDNLVIGEVSMYVIDSNENDHLIMTFRDNSRKSYCLHRYNKEGTKWRHIAISDVLELNIISEELLRSIGDNIKTEDPVNRINKVLNNADSCKKLLEYISYDINSIIVFLDNKNTYGRRLIERLINNRMEMPPIDIATNKVTPLEDTTTMPCIKRDKYKIYKHDLDSAGMNGLEKAVKNHLYLRLYSHSNRIILYEYKKSPATCLTYNKECNELFVYFNKEGNKPFMVYYDGKAYGPQWKRARKWFKIHEINDCKSTDQITRELTRLSKLVIETQVPVSAQRGGGSGAPTTGQGHGKEHPHSRQTQAGAENRSTTIAPHGNQFQTPTGPSRTQLAGNQAPLNTQSSSVSHVSQGGSHGPKPNSGQELSNDLSLPDDQDELDIDPNWDVAYYQNQDETDPSHLATRTGDQQNSDDIFPDWAKGATGVGGSGLVGTGLTFCKHIYVDRKDFSETPSSDFYRLYPGNEVRLFYTYWIKCTKVVKKGDVLEKIICEYDPKTKGGKPEDPSRKVKATIHWMSKEDFYPATFRWYSRLFTKPDPKEGTEGELGWLENLNKESLKVYKGFVEKKATELKVGDPIQFERTGYFTKDPDSTESENVFNLTITLVDAFANKESLLHKETEKKKRLEAIAARMAKKTVK